LPQGEGQEGKPSSVDGTVAAPSPRIVNAANQQVVPTVGNYQNNVANRDYRNCWRRPHNTLKNQSRPAIARAFRCEDGMPHPTEMTPRSGAGLPAFGGIAPDLKVPESFNLAGGTMPAERSFTSYIYHENMIDRR